MKLSFSNRFAKSYGAAPVAVQIAFDKQTHFLLVGLRYPSLHAKKYDEKVSLWQLRVTRDWRAYFTIEEGEYRFHDIKRHPK